MLPESIQIFLHNGLRKKVGKGLLALILTSYIARKVYTEYKVNKNVQKIKKKRSVIEKRKENLELRLQKKKELT